MASQHAIILTGGRSQRMGTDKALLVLAGETLLDRAIEACQHVTRVVVAGPAAPLSAHHAARFVQENPPFGGPVAGVAAAIDALTTDRVPDDDWVLVLACDLVAVGQIVDLLESATPGADGVALVDDEGWPQFLAARYRVGALRRRLDEVGAPSGLSMRRFAAPLDLARVPVSSAVTADVDTPEQAESVGINVHHPQRRPEDDAANIALVSDWVEQVQRELGTPDAPCDVAAILELASVVSKHVARPGVPVTGFVVGWAAGVAHASGQNAAQAAREAIDTTKALALKRPPREK